jgi:hypothetical protein
MSGGTPPDLIVTTAGGDAIAAAMSAIRIVVDDWERRNLSLLRRTMDRLRIDAHERVSAGTRTRCTTIRTSGGDASSQVRTEIVASHGARVIGGPDDFKGSGMRSWSVRHWENDRLLDVHVRQSDPLPLEEHRPGTHGRTAMAVLRIVMEALSSAMDPAVRIDSLDDASSAASRRIGADGEIMRLTMDVGSCRMPVVDVMWPTPMGEGRMGIIARDDAMCCLEDLPDGDLPTTWTLEIASTSDTDTIRLGQTVTKHVHQPDPIAVMRGECLLAERGRRSGKTG